MRGWSNENYEHVQTASFKAFSGGEGGIRTLSRPLESVTYRFYNAAIAMNASIAAAPCTWLHPVGNRRAAPPSIRSPSLNLAGPDSGCASVERGHQFVNRIAEAPADILRTHLDPAETGSHFRSYVQPTARVREHACGAESLWCRRLIRLTGIAYTAGRAVGPSS